MRESPPHGSTRPGGFPLHGNRMTGRGAARPACAGRCAPGVSLVAVRTGGISELVRDGQTGVLVPRRRARLGAALRAVLADPQAAEVRAVREVRRRFSSEKAAVSLYVLVSSQLRTSPVLAAPRLPRRRSSRARVEVHPKRAG